MLATPRPSGEHPAPVPAAARAAISPSALILAGAGAAGGLLVGLPALAAVAFGGALWSLRVAGGAAAAAARRRRAMRPEAIDLYAVPDPWRTYVRESLTAQATFDQAIARSHPGPLRERMAEISGRVHDGVRETWRIAHLGAALSAALTSIDPAGTSNELRRLQQSLVHDTQGASPASQTRAQTDRDESEAALAAQLQAARRVEAAAQRATDRLRVLTAELNAAVASAVELSLDTGEAVAADASRLAINVDSVVGEIEALRLALEEAKRPEPLTGA